VIKGAAAASLYGNGGRHTTLARSSLQHLNDEMPVSDRQDIQRQDLRDSGNAGRLLDGTIVIVSGIIIGLACYGLFTRRTVTRDLATVGVGLIAVALGYSMRREADTDDGED
jgi:hypothetical protein